METGNVAPSFTLKNLDGGNVSLADYKGKVVILNFFATWAPPCIKEIPILKELHKQYKEQELTVIGVSVDRGDMDLVRAFVKKQKITYPIVMSTQEMLDAYSAAIGGKIQQLPTTLVIDNNGRIQEKYLGYQGYQDKSILEAQIKIAQQPRRGNQGASTK